MSSRAFAAKLGSRRGWDAANVVGDVIDVGVAGVEPVHGRGIAVEAVDLQPRLGGTQRHGESDIALADDDER
ncbi:MAG TPA: hypothetical protein VEX40_13400, partial [Mycobacterium sp.]|nr:hypothetical protein [Mycobacterium sp.]